MKSYAPIKKLEQYPFFTQNDIAKLTGKAPAYVRTMLYRLAKDGTIKRIERSKYTLHDDAILFASHITTPSYLGLWTAFRHYHWTQQQPFALFVLSPVSKKTVRFEHTVIRFIKTKHLFGYRKERYGDFEIFISDKEKSIVDALLFHLPFEDVLAALEDKDINFEKLAGYAKKTQNISLIKRLGYLLEKKDRNAYSLEPMDSNYIVLDYLGKKKGKKDTKWRLIINAEL